MKMLSALHRLSAVAAAAAFLFAAAAPAAADLPVLPVDGVLLDSYAAIANGKVITVGDVMTALQASPEAAALSADPAGLADLYRRTRDDLVSAELILQEFRAIGATLPERAVEDRVNSIIHDRFRGSRAAFLEALAAERTTYEEWHARMLDQLVVQLMRQREVDAKIAVTPVDVQAEYEAHLSDYDRPERVRLEAWSIPSPSPSSAPQVAAARDLYRAFLRATRATPPVAPDWPPAPANAPDFVPRAEELPSDWTLAADLAPAFRAAIDGVAAPGSPRPLRIGRRTYFIRLLDREPARRLTLDEAAPAVAAKLRAAQRERLDQIWLDSLRAKYHVQLYEHNLFNAR